MITRSPARRAAARLATARTAARRRAFERQLQRECPWCYVAPGQYHTRNCGTGYINFSDDRGRFLPPPTRRLLAWADCGPDAATMDPARPTSAADSWSVIIATSSDGRAALAVESGSSEDLA